MGHFKVAWIESHQKLKDDPKMVAVSITMGWNIYECIGRLHAFWWWCVDHCEDGDLRRYNDEVLASSVALNGEEAKRFVEAMVAGCGNGEAFVERQPYFRLRNWWKFAGRFLKGKYKDNPSKWQKIKELYDEGTPSVTPSVTHPVAPRTNIPTYLPNQPTNTERGEWFEKHWTNYPRKDGKKEALRHFLASVRSLEDSDRLAGALQNYLRYLKRGKVEERFFKKGSTWFNNWEDWVGWFEDEKKAEAQKSKETQTKVCRTCKHEWNKYERGPLCPVCFPEPDAPVDVVAKLAERMGT
jgi:hypothetical protein